MSVIKLNRNFKKFIDFSIFFSSQNGVVKDLYTFIHMKPTGTPSSPALENIAFPTSFVIYII